MSRVVTPAKTYVVIALVAGSLFALLDPPLQATDEVLHFWRAAAIAHGNLSRAAILPKAYETMVATVWMEMAGRPDVKFTTGRLRDGLAVRVTDEQVAMNVATYYSPLPYLPQTVACLVGRATSLPPLITVYLARFANLICGVLLVALAIRITPVSKWSFALVGLTPMALFIAASSSADVTTMGVAFCFTALLLRAWVGGGELGTRDTLILIAVAFALGLCKPAYVAIVMLAAGIPGARFRSRALRVAFLAAIVSATIAGAAIAARVVSESAGSVARPGMHINAAEQLAGVKSAPLRFVRVAITDLATNGHRYARQFIGQLGWLDIPLPLPITAAYALLLLAAGAAREQSLRRMHLVILVLMATAFIVVLSQYAIWSEVGGERVEGVQGRYFLPIGPLALLLVPRWPRAQTLLPRIAPIVAALANAVALVVLFLRYW